jgi:hypothetical protein
MKHYFHLRIRDSALLSTNVVVQGEDPYNLTEAGIPKIMRFDMVKGKDKQKVLELPRHIREWYIEYQSSTAGFSPDSENRAVLNLDDYPDGEYGDLSLHKVFGNLELVIYDKNMNKLGTLKFMPAKR